MATMKELAGHFGVSIQTMTEYVKRHLDEINADGSHAALRAGKWAFDAEAVRKLEELRGFGIAGVMEAVESKKVKDLEITVDNLQVALLHAQEDAKAAYQQVADAERERRLLAEAQADQVAELATLRERTAAQTEKLSVKDEQIAAQQDEIRRLRQEADQLREEAKRHQEDQSRLAHASLWQRLTGRW